jgi:hypothetical protein
MRSRDLIKTRLVVLSAAKPIAQRHLLPLLTLQTLSG